MPDRRAKLLDEVADYILSNGLAGLSLRPLAAAIDTSPRMLLYFFGSKERLIAQTLAHIRTREQLDFRRAVSKSSSANREGLLLLEWKSWSSPRREKYLRLFFEVYGLALQNRERFPGFLEGAVGEWLPLVERAFAVAVTPEHAQALATLGAGCGARATVGPARHWATITRRGSIPGDVEIAFPGHSIWHKVEEPAAQRRAARVAQRHWQPDRRFQEMRCVPRIRNWYQKSEGFSRPP